MRVLYITPYLPNNLRTRPLYLLKALVPHHDITLLTPVFSAEEDAEASSLRDQLPGLQVVSVRLSKLAGICHSLLALPRRLPMQARYCYSREMIEVARRLVKSGQFDLVHIEHFRAAYLGQELASLDVPIVYDAVDSISLLVSRTLRHGPLKNRLVSRVELSATRRYEAGLLSGHLFQGVCATSQEDAGALEELAGLKPGAVRVIPNGVDLTIFSPPASAEKREPDTVVFSGKMSYHANAAAAQYLVKEIWPRVRMLRHNARLWIVGSRPPADLQALSGQHGIEVTGYVPEVSVYLRQASVAVAPMPYSVGIQNKVLEAMACATPVVATASINRAIAARTGQEICLVEPGRADEFARQIVQLLQEPARAAQIGEQGRDYVACHHNWLEAAGQLEALWNEATNFPGEIRNGSDLRQQSNRDITSVSRG